MNRLDGKSFLRGFGRALDVRGAITPRHATEPEGIQNDGEALAADWAAVFRDLDAAYYRVRSVKDRD